MEPQITSLKELVGKLIVARIPALNESDLVFVQFHSFSHSRVNMKK